MEVEQYHLALQVCEMAQLTFIIGQRNIEHTSLCHLAGVNGLALLFFHDALVLHTLNGDIVQVLSAFGMGVVSVPTGGNGSKHLDIVLITAGVEEQPVAEGLEQREITVGLHRLLEDIVSLDVLFVEIDEFQDTVVGLVHTQCSVLLDGHRPLVQTDLLQGQFLDFLTIVRTTHLIVCGHLRILCLDGYGLCGVDADIDDLI